MRVKAVAARIMKQAKKDESAFSFRKQDKQHANKDISLNLQHLEAGSYMKAKSWQVYKIPGNEKYQIIEQRRQDENIQFNSRRKTTSFSVTKLDQLSISIDSALDETVKEKKSLVMSLYEKLQDEGEKLVLTNNPKYYDENQDEKEKRMNYYSDYIPAKFKKNLSKRLSKKTMDMQDVFVQNEEEIAAADATRERWYIISHSSPYLFYFDVFILIFAVYNAVTLPLQFAFDSVDDQFSREKGFLGLWIFDLSVDIIFIIDIILGFFTTFINYYTGDEIWAPKKIAIHYMKNAFAVDLISTLPVILRPIVQALTIDGSNRQKFYTRAISIMGMFKIVRVRRIAKIISQLNTTTQIKAELNRANTVFILFIFVHTVACILWYFFKQDATWVPPLDFIWVETTLYDDDQTVWHQYLTMLYHSTLVFSLVEIAPRTRFELAYLASIFLISAMVNAQIYGQFSVLSEVLNRKPIEFQETFDLANTAMLHLDIPNELQDKVRTFLLETYQLKDQQAEIQEFLHNLSPSLKDLTKLQVFMNVFATCKLVWHVRINLIKQELKDRQRYQKMKIDLNEKSIPSAEQIYFKLLDELCGLSKLEFFTPETRLITQRDRDTSFMYFIQSGEFKVSVQDKTEGGQKIIEKKIKKLGPSDWFGEVSLFHDSFRTASVTAVNYGACGLLNLPDLFHLTVNYPKFRAVMAAHMQNYSDNIRLFMISALKSISYLKHAKEETISNLAYAMKNEWLEAGTNIMLPGDQSEIMILILSGMVDIITVMDNGTEFTIETLQRGAILNAHSFLIQDKIEVVARATKSTSIFVISRERFTDVVYRDKELVKRITDEIDDIVVSEKQLSLDYHVVRTHFIHPRKGLIQQGAQLDHINELNLLMKNTIMSFILKNREQRKVPRLQDILLNAIEKQKKEKQAKRQRREQMSIADMGSNDQFLSTPQYDLLKEQCEKIHNTLDVQQNNLGQLNKKLHHLLRPISAKYRSKRAYEAEREKKRSRRRLRRGSDVTDRLSAIHTPRSSQASRSKRLFRDFTDESASKSPVSPMFVKKDTLAHTLLNPNNPRVNKVSPHTKTLEEHFRNHLSRTYQKKAETSGGHDPRKGKLRSSQVFKALNQVAQEQEEERSAFEQLTKLRRKQVRKADSDESF